MFPKLGSFRCMFHVVDQTPVETYVGPKPPQSTELSIKWQYMAVKPTPANWTMTLNTNQLIVYTRQIKVDSCTKLSDTKYGKI